jgi:hypothetical protein
VHVSVPTLFRSSMVTRMDFGFQNTFGQQMPSFPPGRVITRREIWVAPYTKRVVELRWVTITVEKQGIYTTEDLREVDPPLDDGTVPESVKQIRECWRCLSIVSNSHLCRACGKEACLACTTEINQDNQKKGGGQKIRVCKDCAASIRNPLLHFAKKSLWG